VSGPQVTHRQPPASPLQFLQQAEQNIAQDISTVIEIISPVEEVSSSDIDYLKIMKDGVIYLFHILQLIH
jgi:hypothetical protein